MTSAFKSGVIIFLQVFLFFFGCAFLLDILFWFVARSMDYNDNVSNPISLVDYLKNQWEYLKYCFEHVR